MAAQAARGRRYGAGMSTPDPRPACRVEELVEVTDDALAAVGALVSQLSRSAPAPTREELTQICDADVQGTVVYQLNVQWFPLSATPGEEDAK